MKKFWKEPAQVLPLQETVVAAKVLEVISQGRFNRGILFGHAVVLYDRDGVASPVFNAGTLPPESVEEAITMTFGVYGPLPLGQKKHRYPFYQATAASHVLSEEAITEKLDSVLPMIRQIGEVALPAGVRASETFYAFKQPSPPLHGRTELDDSYIID